MPFRRAAALRLVAVLTAVTAVGFGLAAPVAAAPATNQQAAAGTRDLGVLNEQVNLTQLRYDRASAALVALQARLADTRAKAEAVQHQVRARAARLYQGAGGGEIDAVLDVGNVNELGRRTQYVAAATKPDRALIGDLARTLDQLDAQEQAAITAQSKLRAEAQAAAAARRKLMAEAAAAAAAAKTQSQTRTDGAGPVGTPRAMLVASSETGSTARTGAPPATPAPHQTPTPATTPHTPSGPPAPSHPILPPPAPSSRAAIAVAYARAQLGKPYVFNTDGPATFDCSGLTMAAWRAAGVRMDHYSGSQAAAFPKVAWSQLQPGDIVVFYADYHHVGLYIGGGMMINAPQTGDVVKIASAWRTSFQFGVRPR